MDYFKRNRDSMTPDKLDDLLGFLAESGNWHTLTEVAEVTELPEEKVEIAASLLEEFHLISYDRHKRRVRIQPRLRQLYLEEPQEAPWPSSYR